MNIHYFQRYHRKEDVATANTMLLLSRLYSYSPTVFYTFLKNEYFSNTFNPEIFFNLQEKNSNSVPDATIGQESFKIVIETKLENNPFTIKQLNEHLKAFGDAKYKVLLSIAPKHMNVNKKIEFEKILESENAKQIYKIHHINTTFEEIVNGIKELLNDRDYEMLEVIDDFESFCFSTNLISKENKEAWKIMRVKLSGITFDFNVKNKVYYDKSEHSYREHDYLGLYKDKSVKAIGKINSIISAVEANDGTLKTKIKKGSLTTEREETIKKAMENDFNIKGVEHDYFFVDEFVPTNFKKESRGALFGTKLFDLTNILSKEILPSVEEIACQLNNLTWE